MNLEHALPPRQPNDPRWDYAIGIAGLPRDAVLWLEVHPASSTGNVAEVLHKLAWLKTWMQGNAPALWRLGRRFGWLATGRVAFRPGSPQRLKVAQHGLVFRARQLDLDQF